MKREDRIICAHKRVMCFPAEVNKWLTGHLDAQAEVLQVVQVFLWYFSYFDIH